MYKYIKAYQMGYNHGMIEACKDFNQMNFKCFKKINKKYYLSKLYDIGFIDGYNKTIKNMTFNLDKNIV